MFGSEVLEVGIGLILIFLLVSLVLTAVRETIESWTKTRSRDLERAIAELLDDRGGDGLRAKLYQHPLINGLFKGVADPSTFSDASGNTARKGSSNLPSYIPRETFALALFDLLEADENERRAGKVEGGAGRPSARLAQAFEILDRTAGGEPQRVRRHLEQWFDAAMDRASGWYRRRTQKLLFWLGLGVAVALNINGFVVAQYLSTQDAAREQAVKISDSLLDDPQVRDALRAGLIAPGSGAAAARPQPGTDGSPVNSVAADGNGAAPETSEAAELTEPSLTPAAEADGPADGDKAGGEATLEPNAVRTRLQGELLQAGLPIGWNRTQWDYVKRQFDAPFWFGGFFFLLSWLAGFAAVAFAGTLGAPFWFDVLGKVMVIRSTVKPTEKSPDELSKDGGTGGSPAVGQDGEEDDAKGYGSGRTGG